MFTGWFEPVVHRISPMPPVMGRSGSIGNPLLRSALKKNYGSRGLVNNQVTRVAEFRPKRILDDGSSFGILTAPRSLSSPSAFITASPRPLVRSVAVGSMRHGSRRENERASAAALRVPRPVCLGGDGIVEVWMLT